LFLTCCFLAGFLAAPGVGIKQEGLETEQQPAVKNSRITAAFLAKTL